MKKTVIIGIILGSSAGFSALGAAATSVYDEAKSTVQQWAEVKSLVSKELADWNSERAILEDLAQMLEAEKSSLEERIEATRESATEADKRRAEVVDQRDALASASSVVRENIESLEDAVRSLVPYFPNQYRESIGPLLRQIPEQGKDSQLSISIRLRNVIGVLSQANKFDNTISVETETRDFEDGASRQVETMYLGFGIAYFADTTGTYAGIGYPTAEGWIWEDKPESGVAILDAIAMYRRGKQADFVTLPLVIK